MNLGAGGFFALFLDPVTRLKTHRKSASSRGLAAILYRK